MTAEAAKRDALTERTSTMAENDIFDSVPDDWEATTLGEVVRRGGGSIQTGPFGSQLHAADYVEVGIPSIMPVNIGDNRIVETDIARIPEADAQRLSKHRVQEGDIVYSRRGDVERRALVRKDQVGWLCGTGCLKVRLGRGVTDPLFTSLFLGHPRIRAWIVQHAVGATMPNLNTDIMSAVPFLLPPLPEQRAIAGILGTLDDKIELNRRRNRTLEEMARAIFRSWFVDFDPVTAKAAGRAPAGLSPAVAALFPDAFADSELGPIPKGWQWRTLREIAQVQSGGTPRKSNAEYWAGSIPWISPKAMNNIHVHDSEEHVSEAAIGNGTRLVPKGSILVMVRGMGLHQGVRISQAERAVAFNQDTKALLPECVPSVYLLFGLLAASGVLLSKVQSSGHGTGVLPTEFLDRLPFAVPQEPALQKLVEPLAALNDKICVSRRESLTLASLRDALLPKLVSGELRVSDAERIVGRMT